MALYNLVCHTHRRQRIIIAILALQHQKANSSCFFKKVAFIFHVPPPQMCHLSLHHHHFHISCILTENSTTAQPGLGENRHRDFLPFGKAVAASLLESLFMWEKNP